MSNVELWDSQISTVERMLKFLTGDFWKITLSGRTWEFSNPEEKGMISNPISEGYTFSLYNIFLT